MKLWAKRRRTAIVAAAVLVTAGLTVPATPAMAAASCDVTYATNDWSNGFTANVTLTNLGDPINGWTLRFAFPGNQQVTQGWSATWSQSGNQVTATSLSYNGTLATGASTNIGFNGSYSGSNPKPTSFSINGVTCGGASSNQAPTVSLSVPAGPFTAPADVPLTATASDPDGSISKVEFYRNGMLINTDTTAPYTYTQSALPAGSYTVQAKAYDNGTPALTATAEKSFTVSAPSGPAIIATPASVTVPEGGSVTVRYTLSAAPSGNVTIALSKTGDPDITLSATSVTLTPSNWNTGVAVTVSAAQDADTTNGTATIRATATGYSASEVTATEADDDVAGGTYVTEFMTLYNKLKAPSNGYFSPEGVPYHSVETFLVEAPDHGHETTSEAFSYWLWLEAQYGRIQGNWAPFNNAWTVMEKYIIPSGTDYHSGGYNAGSPAQYAPEKPYPDQYPVAFDTGVQAGRDPLYDELTSTYGNSDVYGMHWLIDVDNVYGFGKCGDHTTRPAYINTYQRGPQESVFETITQPSCETFADGGPNGYGPLFTQDSNPAKQWKFTNAPDADARAVEAAYWALQWATEQGKQADIAATVAKAAKMGDYLRYAMYDKYFKKPGCTSPSCAAGTGKDASSYLLSWYYAWGGAMDGAWSWRIGSSHNHSGYQNPMAAYALSTVSALTPRSASAKTDWSTSLTRQIDFYTWLQSSEGGIAGGATNSWNGDYEAPPAGTPTFYGLAYDWQPVYHDPPSNQWFGFQAWSMERVAEYYHESGDTRAKAVLDKWVAWAIANTTTGANGAYQIPSTLAWSGQPGGNWTSGTTSVNNSGLHVTVQDYTNDVGVAGAYARTLVYYGAKSGNAQAKATAKALLDGILTHSDAKGVAVPETRADYNRLDDVYNSSTHQGLFVPSGFSGTMPNGDVIAPGKSFLDIRSFYKNDPDWPKVEAYLNGGAAPVFTYHRFWAQSDVALALADYGMLIG
ncbi:glycoside hydrolase family 48 protein [Plantactinospora sp. KBS50]|uniref:glycoside hydrolase family 48 protein n=1 Tax=Plantactinospora sp. KBS50 TaxID=2024580 RepID=UPI000BAA9C83|nr:glycoside hydrolase family 48 protein [Plantactinospora sp. KBS50]ASW55814.1 cellulose 1,4-beta-cellobiosidase [Plantactinospora sp. KBS50]